MDENTSKNDIQSIQRMLMNEMKRLDDDTYMKDNTSAEVARSNALTGSATTYIKSVNVLLRLQDAKEKELKIKGIVDNAENIF